tara:strand:- start:328 stop:1410 length:1083 start_codon:yes stop_codon:yes gene_type:complete
MEKTIEQILIEHNQLLEKVVNRLELLEDKESDVKSFSKSRSSNQINSNANCSSSLISSRDEEGEIELKELSDAIFQGKLTIIIITIIFSILSVIYAISLPNIYKSEALLAPNIREQGGGLGALAGQFGGLASLAGINLGGGNYDKIGYTLEVIRSRQFLYNFILQNDLKAPLLAAKGWNVETNTLVYDANLYNVKSGTWVRGENASMQSEPSLFKAYEQFVKENLTVSRDSNTGMVAVGVSHYSPILARELVDKIVKEINQTIKQQDLAEATKSIRYLEKEVEATNVTSAQTMFYQLIEKQQQTIMLTKVRDDYVLKIVDPAVIAEEKTKPKRALISILGAMLGGVLAVFIVLIRYFKNK